jgi:hypothetical protein
LERARFRDTRNLLCWSLRDPLEIPFATSLPQDEAGPESLAAFQARWDAFSNRLRILVAEAPKPIVGIGASHIQLNFLNFTGLDDAVDILIDDDPWKVGRFAPLAKPTPIRTTSDILTNLREGTLLKIAFPYPEWERRIGELLKTYGIKSIEPYRFNFS